MIAEFISKFIKECVQKGFSSQNEIVDCAKKEIEEIDVKLNEADLLRVRRDNLKKVLKHYGVSLTPPKIIPQEDIVEYAKQIAQVVNTCGPLTNREIMCKMGYNKDVAVIKGLKWLTERGIIQRDGTPDNKVLKGPKFEEYLTSNASPQ